MSDEQFDDYDCLKADRAEAEAAHPLGEVPGSAICRCRMCGWRGTLDQAEEAGTDCPSCPDCGAEATKLGSPAIAPDEGPVPTAHKSKAVLATPPAVTISPNAESSNRDQKPR